MRNKLFSKPSVQIIINKDDYSYVQYLYMSFMLRQSKRSLVEVMQDMMLKDEKSLLSYIELEYNTKDPETFMINNIK